MEKCTRLGCRLSYDPSANASANCHFHPGSPLFHEGLKSYTCCNTVNKPVLSFDDFLKIPGCTTGSHSSEKSEVKAPVVTANAGQGTQGGTVSQAAKNTPASTISSGHANAVASTSNLGAQPVYKSRPVSPTSLISTESEASDEQDPQDCVIPAGSKCKRLGCNVAYALGMRRSEEECSYHPQPAIFHEGSKGYACCKKRVLEFDEFLKIEGCKQAKHCFVGKIKDPNVQEAVDCRSDMYQTPSQVICSIFGKGADKKKSSIIFSEWDMTVDLLLPTNKRFHRQYALFGPIKADVSSYRILGTKVEVSLVKGDGRSWPQLEAASNGRSIASQITFGVSGRTGSVGSKDIVYRGDVVQA